MEEYEKQLEQINEALSSCANDEDRKDLETLKENLKQLIELSFLESIENLEQEVDENQKEVRKIVVQYFLLNFQFLGSAE